MTTTPAAIRSAVRLRADARANLDKVLAAAEAVFAEHGLDTSIELVAERAGVGMGTVYRRFANKAALVSELVSRLLAAIVEIAERHLDDPDGHGLHGYLTEVCELLAANRGAVTRLWTDLAGADVRERAQELQAQLVASAVAGGAVREDLTTADVTVAIWSVQGILEVTRGTTVQAWRRHLDMLWTGLEPGAIAATQPPMSVAEMNAVTARRRQRRDRQADQAQRARSARGAERGGGHAP